MARLIRAELIDHMGSDLRVANAARVSFDKESEWDDLAENEDGTPRTAGGFISWLNPRDAKLIAYLARHDHFTPFTHCVITLRETVPIFVARQRFKHVVGFTYNEVSRRYVDSEPEFYAPEVWRKRADDKKQGSSAEAVEWGDFYVAGLDMTLAGTPQHAAKEAAHVCLEVYRSMLAAGIAPEQARMVLPQSMMTSYYVTGSLCAFSRAYNLRSQPDAQAEIRELAEQWDRIIGPLFPVSWAALTRTSTIDPSCEEARHA